MVLTFFKRDGMQKSLESIVKKEKPKEKLPGKYIQSVEYKKKEKQKRTHEGINERDMLLDMVYIDYFKIFSRLYKIGYEAYRRIQLWKQSNPALAKCYGIK